MSKSRQQSEPSTGAPRKAPLPRHPLLNYHLKVENFPEALAVLEQLGVGSEPEGTSARYTSTEMADLAIKRPVMLPRWSGRLN